MAGCKSIFRSSALLLALCLTVILSGCGGQVASSPTDVVPVLCHSEYEVGLLFVTLENRGNDAGPSTMTLAYKTASSLVPQIHLQVKTLGVPTGTEIWVAVELPTISGAGGFLKPAGRITITVDNMRVLSETNRANKALVTYCKDGR